MPDQDTPEPQAEQPQNGAVARRETFVPLPVHQGTLRPRNFPELIEMARMLAHSTLVPNAFRGQVGDVLVAIQMGGEVGLSPMASLRNIAVINGRPSIWGDALLALVQSHPDCEDVIEELNEETLTATCTVKRRGRTPTVRTFSKADAVTAKLWNKKGRQGQDTPWITYPKRMLQMRARAFALRDSFPDALGGLYVAEEAADMAQPIPVTATLSAADFALPAVEHRIEEETPETPASDAFSKSQVEQAASDEPTPAEVEQGAAGPPAEPEKKKAPTKKTAREKAIEAVKAADLSVDAAEEFIGKGRRDWNLTDCADVEVWAAKGGKS